jgi:RNA recognition motif-containing protein
MTGNYGPAAAAAAAAAAGNQTGRTVYVGNLPADASVDELLNLVRFGPIESVRLLPEKSCVFISFLDGSTAAAFHADASVKKLALHGQELKIGWGKPSLVPAIVAHAIHQAAATRNVYVGSLDSALTEQELRDDLGRFGPIDQVKIVRDKNIGFVHFLSIATAMKVVATLPTEPAWAGKRVNYGKDRCAYVPKAQQAAVQAAQAQAAAAISSQTPFTPFTSPFSYPSPPAFHPFDNQAGNRCVYLGGIHHEATVEDLCNAIRGGMLQQIRYLADKHIAFVTFIDPGHALAFHQNATFNGLSISQRRVKVGWGKHSGTIHPATAMAVQAGASRNVYVGAITDFDTFTDDKLRRDFGEYGDIELVNFLKEKNAAFVNLWVCFLACADDQLFNHQRPKGHRGHEEQARVRRIENLVWQRSVCEPASHWVSCMSRHC